MSRCSWTRAADRAGRTSAYGSLEDGGASLKDRLGAEQLSQLSDFVAATVGLYFPHARWADLEHQSALAAQEFGFDDTQAFLNWLLNSPLTQEQAEMLASYLTISETYFWREPRVFEALRDRILPELIMQRATGTRRLRLWSAGCASGEEPYSIAIALCEALPALKDWHVTLLATDINPRILRRAATGVYGDWSFRNTPDGFKDKYFTRTADGKYELHLEIRKMVTFAYLNLVENSFPAAMSDTNAMDLIFCRNVLMYFTPERARLVGQRLRECLVAGGWFVVSSSELSAQTFPNLAHINFPGAIVYRRVAQAPPIAAAAPTRRVPARQALPMKAAPARVGLPSKPIPPQVTIPAAKADRGAEQSDQVEALQAVRVLANQGRLLEAWAACEGAIAADKMNPALYYLGATILQELNREDEALSVLNGALYLDPNSVMVHFALGNLAQRRGNATGAARGFHNVLALLEKHGAEDILADADGLTAGRLREIVRATLQMGVATQ